MTLDKATASWILETSLTAIAIVAIAWAAHIIGHLLIKRIIRRAVKGHHVIGKKSKPSRDVKKRQDTLISILDVLWRIIVISTALVALFKLFFPHIDLTPLIASAGIIGVAVGFGAQTIVRDFLGGMFIITENQYRVGDVVELEGTGISTPASGTVERIGIRSTVVRDASGNVHYVPNGNISHVINKTMDFSNVRFTVSVQPDTDIDHLMGVINQVGDKLANSEKWSKKIMEAPHFLSLGSFNDIALEVNIGGKTQPSEQWAVTSEMKKRLLKEFQKQHIELSQFNPGS